MKNILVMDRDEVEELIYGASLVKSSIVEQGRWTTLYEYVFKKDGKLWLCEINRGSTEMQDGMDDYEDTIECVEVEEYEKTIIDYREVEVGEIE